MLKIDIGCGPAKRPDFMGVDFSGEPDVLCDISLEKLPFDDLSVDHIHSAHCLEHIAHKDLLHVFKEMTRVAADNALIELWHPHPFHGDAFVLGHINYLSEALYAGLRTFWKDTLGAEWVIQEIRYRIEPHVLEDIAAAGIEADFAICYLHDIVKEIGVLVRVERVKSTEVHHYRRFLCHDREHTLLQLADGPRLNSLARRAEGLIGNDAAECSKLKAVLAQTIAERDALSASSMRWFEAVIAITEEHNPFASRPPTKRGWWRSVVGLSGAYRRLSARALGDRARAARKWELAVRYYRDALDLDPDNPEIWAQCGHALKEAGKASEAELALRRSRELNTKQGDWVHDGGQQEAAKAAG
jgi:tetratricopeptide (TPR) repeat protein